MSKQRPVIGLDIGIQSIKAVRIDKDGIEWLSIKRPEKCPDDLHKLIPFYTPKDILIIGLPSEYCISRTAKLPPIDKKRIPQIAQFEADQQIPFDLDEVNWDYHRSDTNPDKLIISAIRIQHLTDFLSCLPKNVKPDMATPNMIALYNAMLIDGQITDDNTVFIDIGTKTTDLIVASNRCWYGRTINIGGNNFRDRLCKCFNCSPDKAEVYKNTVSEQQYSRQILHAMRPVMADLVAEIQRSLGFFLSVHQNETVSDIVFMKPFNLPGLTQYIDRNLSLNQQQPCNPSRILENFNKIQDCDPTETQCNSTFAIAYGLALQGLSPEALSINLMFPESFSLWKLFKYVITGRFIKG